METAIQQSKFKVLLNRKRAKRIDKVVFGKKVGVIAKLFGCWHENISRPFVQDKTSYRACLNCGARKQFNPETLETHGNFYFPPIVREECV